MTLIDERFKRQDRRFDKLDASVTRIENKLDATIDQVDNHESRLKRLEVPTKRAH
jgi:hypothetical protein